LGKGHISRHPRDDPSLIVVALSDGVDGAPDGRRWEAHHVA